MSAALAFAGALALAGPATAQETREVSGSEELDDRQGGDDAGEESDEIPYVPGQPAPDIPREPVPEAQGKLSEDFDILGGSFDIGGYFWVDTGYLNRTNERDADPDQETHYMNGRYVLSATYGGEVDEWFAMARVQLMGLVNEFARSQYEPHALDAFVRIGHEDWGDITVGRFLGWQAYYRGQGIELFTAEEAGALNGQGIYLLDRTRGYRNEAGQAALHFYPFDFLSFEIAGVYGQENSQNQLGIRPVVVFDLAGLVAIAGMEYQHQFNILENDRTDTEQLGFSGQLRYSIGPITAGGNVSTLRQDVINIREQADTAESFDVYSFGGFVDADFSKVSMGIGYHITYQDNDLGELNEHNQMFASFLYRLPFEGVSLKLVYGYAWAYIEDIVNQSEAKNDLHSARLRISYVFN